MNKKIILLFFLVLALPVCFAQQINEVTNIIPYQSSVTIVCSLNPEFNKFYLDNPPRVAVDLTNCELKFDKEVISLESKYIQRVRVKQFKTQPVKIVRVVLDLYKKYDYNVQIDSNNNLVINLIVQKPKLQVVENTKETEVSKKESTAKTEEVEVKKDTTSAATQISKPKVEQTSTEQQNVVQQQIKPQQEQVIQQQTELQQKPVVKQQKEEQQKTEEKEKKVFSS